MGIDYAQFEQLARDLEAQQSRLPDRLRGRQIRAMRDLLRVARGVVHVQSGDLRDSLYILEPSTFGEITESAIASDLSYASQEADKGGSHDYPARTIEEGTGVIDQLEDDVADLIADAFTGQGNG